MYKSKAQNVGLLK